MASASTTNWWSLAKDLWAQIGEDRVISVAAGVAFYAILAIVPSLTALISLFGLLAAPEDVPAQLEAITSGLPSDAASLLTDQASRIAAKADETLSLTALIALVIALWSANGGTKAMIEALNIAYKAPETRGFVRLNLVSLGLTLGGLLVVIVLALVVAALPLILDAVGGVGATLALVLRWPILLAGLLGVLAALYRFAPYRPDAEWIWITPGAIFAAIGVILISAGLGWYVTNFGSYDETYGSLAAVVVLMLWLWLSTAGVLIGAEINAELERREGTAPRSRVSLAS